MSVFDERAGGDRRDVAHVYEARAGVADGLVDAPLGGDLPRLSEEVLHEEVRPQHRPGEAGRFQVIFGLAGPLAEAFGRAGVRAEGGELHDVSHARALRRLDEVALKLEGLRRGRRQEQRALDAFERGVQRLRPVEVAPHGLEPRLAYERSSAWVAHERAHARRPKLMKLAYDLFTRRPRAACH